uniref:NADH dehydrogenase [ubiquinone] 1 beta subcomplex subunit 5, mitochondrial n=1 Tax=Angiostrongylus cantonensis TaxID=6313 RepID=A0A0K0DCQ2_ANGCA
MKIVEVHFVQKFTLLDGNPNLIILFQRELESKYYSVVQDYCHFYFIGIGILPVVICLAYNHIVYGTCELRDYPEKCSLQLWSIEGGVNNMLDWLDLREEMDFIKFISCVCEENGVEFILAFLLQGDPPHYWQFERTPVRQWWAKHFGVSDIEHHERNLAYYEKLAIQARWRQIEQRVKHLEGERWDYKAWSYQPVSATWVDYSRWHALRVRDQYEQHGHYPQ